MKYYDIIIICFAVYASLLIKMAESHYNIASSPIPKFQSSENINELTTNNQENTPKITIDNKLTTNVQKSTDNKSISDNQPTIEVQVISDNQPTIEVQVISDNEPKTIIRKPSDTTVKSSDDSGIFKNNNHNTIVKKNYGNIIKQSDDLKPNIDKKNDLYKCIQNDDVIMPFIDNSSYVKSNSDKENIYGYMLQKLKHTLPVKHICVFVIQIMLFICTLIITFTSASLDCKNSNLKIIAAIMSGSDWIYFGVVILNALCKIKPCIGKIITIIKVLVSLTKLLTAMLIISIGILGIDYLCEDNAIYITLESLSVIYIFWITILIMSALIDEFEHIGFNNIIKLSKYFLAYHNE
jgi:hypothetical protein